MGATALRRTVVRGLSVLTAGEAAQGGSRIIFVHGICTGAWVFEGWLRWFAERGYKAYALDLRGHGESPWQGNLGKVSLRDYVEDVKCLLEITGPSVLVGHSLGGLIAQMVASEYPDLVQKAVFVTSGPPAGIFIAPAMARKMPKYWRALVFGSGFLPSFEDIRELMLNQFPSDEAWNIYQRLGEESGKVARQIPLKQFAFWQTKAIRISCPMLVIGASYDPALPLSVQKRIAARYGSRYIEVERGHLPMLEPNWQEPAEVIRSWLGA
jgi:pimeloyl-ACP methyl ester carboxylesterase